MLNYIKSECYKTWKRIYTRILILILALFTFAVNAGIAIFYLTAQSSGSPLDFSIFQLIMEAGLALFQVPFYLVLIFSDIVFSDEYKHRTLKNTLSFGITRTQLYFGKLVVSILLTFVSGLVFALVFMGSALAFSGIPNDWSPLLILINHAIAALPLYIGALCLSHAIVFIVPNNTAFSFVYLGVLLIPSGILSILSLILNSPILTTLNSWTISVPVYSTIVQLGNSLISTSAIIHNLAVGILYSVICTIIGLFVFKKREIK